MFLTGFLFVGDVAIKHLYIHSLDFYTISMYLDRKINFFEIFPIINFK